MSTPLVNIRKLDSNKWEIVFETYKNNNRVFGQSFYIIRDNEELFPYECGDLVDEIVTKSRFPIIMENNIFTLNINNNVNFKISMIHSELVFYFATNSTEMEYACTNSNEILFFEFLEDLNEKIKNL